jgi:hypothetical protein
MSSSPILPALTPTELNAFGHPFWPRRSVALVTIAALGLWVLSVGLVYGLAQLV